MFGTKFPRFKFLGGTLPSRIPMTPWVWLDGGSGAKRAAARMNTQLTLLFFLCSGVANTSCTSFQL